MKTLTIKLIVAVLFAGFLVGFGLRAGYLPLYNSLYSYDRPFIIHTSKEDYKHLQAVCTNDPNCMDTALIDDLPKRDVACDTDSDCVQKTGINF